MTSLTVKIAGSVMTIQIENGENTSMATTATILNTVALSPLLNASLCFLNVGYVYISSRTGSMEAN